MPCPVSIFAVCAAGPDPAWVYAHPAQGPEPDNTMSAQNLYRHARLHVVSAVLLSRGAESAQSEMVDISATGLCVQRPQQWQGGPGQLWTLDLLLEGDAHVNLEATCVRETANKLCFEFTRIPEDRQIPLWNLLGGYADRVEAFSA